MYTTDNLVLAVIGGFISYPIVKFLLLAIVEKAINDTDKEFESFNINDDK